MHLCKICFTFALLIFLAAPLGFSQQSVIIVVRHGEDMDSFVTSRNGLSSNWANVCPTWPTNPISYKLVHTDGHIDATSSRDPVSCSHGLSYPGYTHQDNTKTYSGEQQAQYIKLNLPTLLSLQNYAPITRVITKTPINNPENNSSGAAPSANPFDTAYPFILANPSVEVLLIKKTIPWPNTTPNIVDEGLRNMIANSISTNPTPTNALLPSSGSTLLVWDRDGMWGAKNTSAEFKTNSILWQLASDTIGDRLKINNFSPGKGTTVYIFRKRPSTGLGTTSGQRFDLEIYLPEISSSAFKYPEPFVSNSNCPTPYYPHWSCTVDTNGAYHTGGIGVGTSSGIHQSPISSPKTFWQKAKGWLGLLLKN